MFDELELSRENKNIVVLHGALRNYSGAKDGISIPDAADRGIGYMALGHYHSYSVTSIDQRTDAVYCGAPEGRGFDEAGEHGFVIIDTDTAPISHRFFKSAKREIKIIEVDVSDAGRRIDIEDKLDTALREATMLDLVRVVLVGKRSPELTIDVNALLASRRNKFYYLEIKDETGLLIDPMTYLYDKSLKGEFIRLVYSREDISEEMKEKIIRCGIAALLGEDTGI
jgi:DNA repair exonuclease SbcCD nuclease subunit